jgi:hypothetical protein
LNDYSPTTTEGREHAKHRPERFSIEFLLGLVALEGERRTAAYPRFFVWAITGMHTLDKTNLPTSELQRFAFRFREEDECFLWLRLEVPLSHDVRPPEWEIFLGIGYPKSDLDFHLAILRFILDTIPWATSLTRVTKLYEL